MAIVTQVGNGITLKYLFGALLLDGSEILQQDDDICPTATGRTAFWDLLAKDDDGNPIPHPTGGFAETRSDIRLFMLEADDGTRYVVDLGDGHFEIQWPKYKNGNGAYSSRSFWIAEPPVNQPLRLFYFRRRRQHATAKMSITADGTPQFDSCEDAGQECEYHFGWQTVDRKQKAEMILT